MKKRKVVEEEKANFDEHWLKWNVDHFEELGHEVCMVQLVLSNYIWSKHHYTPYLPQDLIFNAEALQTE